MKIPIYHVDAFSTKIFSGNPAAVCLLSTWLPEAQLQLIAAENLLPVTAFIKREANGYSTRWFTPDNELLLCGHGSLASGFIIFHYLEQDKSQIELHHPHAGVLNVLRVDDHIKLEFPSKAFISRPLPDLLMQGLQIPVIEFYAHQQERCLIVVDNEMTVRNLKPDLHLLRQIDYPGLVITAPGEHVDFVSRTFYPRKTTFQEDPVTGASHCLLTPYWAQKLGKNTLTAQQLSPRGGYLTCELQADKVLISGRVVLYGEGTIFI